jgi:hypothetical protein
MGIQVPRNQIALVSHEGTGGSEGKPELVWNSVLVAAQIFEVGDVLVICLESVGQL